VEKNERKQHGNESRRKKRKEKNEEWDVTPRGSCKNRRFGGT
jgi:hypothetical protein